MVVTSCIRYLLTGGVVVSVSMLVALSTTDISQTQLNSRRDGHVLDPPLVLTGRMLGGKRNEKKENSEHVSTPFGVGRFGVGKRCKKDSTE